MKLGVVVNASSAAVTAWLHLRFTAPAGRRVMKRLLAVLVLAGGISGCASVPDSVLIARGETARGQLQKDLWVDVSGSGSGSPDAIKADIQACKDKARKAVGEVALEVYEWTSVINPGTLEREGDIFIACLKPKGYSAEMWDPRGH